MAFSPNAEHLLARLPTLAGWRRNMLLWVVGALSATAFAPLNVFPAIVVGLAVLLLVLDGAATKRRAFADGWWFAYGNGIAGIYWIAISLTVDTDRFAWMIPFAVFGITAVLALYAGLATYACWRLPTTGLRRVVVFALCWTVTEGLRGSIPYGFPWNLVGSAWGGWDITLQAASLVGVYGLSLYTCFAAGVLVWPWLRRPLAGAWDCRPHWRSGVFACVWVLALPMGYGAIRLIDAPALGTPLAMQPDARLRLVQPAIPQTLKWDPRYARASVLGQLHLSRLPSPKETPLTHIIWPEAALPFRLKDTPALVHDMAAAAPKNGGIIAGSVRMGQAKPAQNVPFYNSMEMVRDTGDVVAVYDKIELVPFGEFVPLRSVLPIDKITPGQSDFSRGTAYGAIAQAGLPAFAALICYEIIFPGFVRSQSQDYGNGHAQWILNITNDAWFGESSGPYQHFISARLRAAELGLPVIRVANDGITAVVDGYGRVVDALPRGARGVLDTGIPKPLTQQTWVARLGYLPTLGLAMLLLLLASASLRRR